ncbi:transposable element Tcb1 transposase [Trichonephila clavipes]|nr:transposable element Tcb1 transposase [Trichonephila clavipes]
MTLIIHIDDHLTSDHYVTRVIEPVFLPLLQGAPNMVFQQDNARPHVARKTLNNQTGFDILPRLENSPDLNNIELMAGFNRNDMNREPLVKILDDLRLAD